MTEQTRVTRKAIIGCTAAALNLNPADITGQKRSDELCKARWICVALFLEFDPKVSRPLMGESLGGRDHSTISHAVRRGRALAKSDPEFADKLGACRERVLSWAKNKPPLPVSVRFEPETPQEEERHPARKFESPRRVPDFWAGQEPLENQRMRQSLLISTKAMAKAVGSEKAA